MQLLISKSTIIKLWNNPHLGEIFRFGIVGTIATALHYGIYYLLVQFIEANISYSIGYALSFIANFYLSNYFTFRTKPSIGKGIGFGISHGINYLLHMALLNIFLWIGLSEEYAPLPVFAIVIPVNFLLVRFVLKSKKI